VIVVLCIVAFLAGFVDSVVGGGGLIQLPALLLALPAVPIPVLFGTNKLSSIAGTLVAALQFARKIKIRWPAVLPGTLSAFLFSMLGARAVTLLDAHMLRPIIFLLLVLVAIYTFCHKEFGAQHAPRLARSAEIRWSLGLGMLLGFYDGFFGPGTGSFLLLGFVAIFGYDFLNASASAKTINLATNLAALIYFASSSNILYAVAIPMAVCNVLGSIVGTRLAILKGNSFVRRLLLCVVLALLFRLGLDLF